MAQETARVLRASAAAVAAVDAVGAAVDLGADTTVDVDMFVTAISVGATLDVVIETSRNAAIGWRTVEPKYWDESAAAELKRRFTRVTATVADVASPAAQFIVFPGCDRYVRARWTLAGGTATFEVSGRSVRVYAKPSEVPELIPIFVPGAPEGGNVLTVSDERIDRALRAMTDATDSALAMQGPTPLATWPSNIREGCANCAATFIIAEDKRKPRQKDERIKQLCEAYDAWLEKVATGKRGLPGAVDPTPEVDDGGAYAVSDAKRGW